MKCFTMQGILPKNFQNISVSARKGHIIFALDPTGIMHTVKPALTVTSVKRSPAYNGQLLALPTFFTI